MRVCSAEKINSNGSFKVFVDPDVFTALRACFVPCSVASSPRNSSSHWKECERKCVPDGILVCKKGNTVRVRKKRERDVQLTSNVLCTGGLGIDSDQGLSPKASGLNTITLLNFPNPILASLPVIFDVASHGTRAVCLN
jgi:hypothetical protein